MRGKLGQPGQGQAGRLLFCIGKPNIPIALIEAKDNTHALGETVMQQALDYAETLNIPLSSPPTAGASYFTTGPA